MIQDSDKFTLEELETLSEAYLECRLTKLEEKELEMLLLSYELSSPIIDEARETMGVTTLLGTARSGMEKKSDAGFRRIFLRVAAACAVILAGITFWYIHSDSAGMDPTEGQKVIVYVDGHLLSEQEALKKAAEKEKQCMAMLKRAESQAAELENKYNTLLKKNKLP